jgi:hypothetical protein
VRLSAEALRELGERRGTDGDHFFG